MARVISSGVSQRLPCAELAPNNSFPESRDSSLCTLVCTGNSVIRVPVCPVCVPAPPGVFEPVKFRMTYMSTVPVKVQSRYAMTSNEVFEVKIAMCVES